jgi:hypothetical protein
MQFFTWLQDTPFAHWVASDPSLLAYPTILTLHTVGMAIVVGTCVVIDLRLLGIGGDIPLTALGGAPRTAGPLSVRTDEPATTLGHGLYDQRRA